MMHVIFRDGLEDRGLPRAPRAGRTRSCASGRASGRRSATAATTGLRRREIEALRARVRDDAALGHPPQLRPQPPRRRRDGRAHRSPACPPWSGPGAHAGGGRAALDLGHLPGRRGRARAARPRPAGHAHPQHEPARPRPDRPDARPAGEGALRLQLEPGRGGARAGEGARGPRARGPVHRRPRAVPDRHRRLRRHRSCPPPPRSSTTTSTRPTGTSTSASAARRSRRSARRCRTPRCSGGSPRGWASTTRACARRDEEMARHAFKLGPPAPRRASPSSGSSARARVRLSVPDPFVPFAEGGFPTPSGKCELRSGEAGRGRASTRWPATCRRARARRARPSSRGATRSRSSRRPRTTS